MAHEADESPFPIGRQLLAADLRQTAPVMFEAADATKPVYVRVWCSHRDSIILQEQFEWLDWRDRERTKERYFHLHAGEDGEILDEYNRSVQLFETIEVRVEEPPDERQPEPEPAAQAEPAGTHTYPWPAAQPQRRAPKAANDNAQLALFGKAS